MSSSGTTEKVRTLVESEGVNARNLIAWRVPNEVPQQHLVAKRAARKARANLNSSATSTNTNSDESEAEVRSIANSLLSASTGATGVSKSSRSSLRLRPSSADRQRMPVTGDSRARFWGMLIDNLKRSVDELYVACETDASEVECREVMMVLELCVADFRHLIDKLRVLRVYEASREAGKCVSVSWNERKTSPAKPIFSSTTSRRTAAMRMLSSALGGGLLRTAEQLSPYLTSTTNEQPDEAETGTESNTTSPNGSVVQRPVPAPPPTALSATLPQPQLQPQPPQGSTAPNCTPISVNVLFALAAQTDSAKAKANANVATNAKPTASVAKPRSTLPASAPKTRNTTAASQPQMNTLSGATSNSNSSMDTNKSISSAETITANQTDGSEAGKLNPQESPSASADSDGETGWSKVAKRGPKSTQQAAAAAQARVRAKQQQLLNDPKSLRRYVPGDLKQQRTYGKSVSDNQLHRATTAAARSGGKTQPSAVREDDADASAAANAASISSSDMQMQGSLSAMKHPSDGELRVTDDVSKPTQAANGKPNWSQIVAGRPKAKTVVNAAQQKTASASADSIANADSSPARPHTQSDPNATPAVLTTPSSTPSTVDASSLPSTTTAKTAQTLNYAAKVKSAPKSAEATPAATQVPKVTASAVRKQLSTPKPSAAASNVRSRTTPTPTVASTSRTGNTAATRPGSKPAAGNLNKSNTPKTAGQSASQPTLVPVVVKTEAEPPASQINVEKDSQPPSEEIPEQPEAADPDAPITEAGSVEKSTESVVVDVIEVKATLLTPTEATSTVTTSTAMTGIVTSMTDGDGEASGRDNEENTVDERIREIELALDAVTMREEQLATEIEDAQKQLDHERNEPLNLADSVASTLSVLSSSQSRVGRSSHTDNFNSALASTPAHGGLVTAQSVVDVEMVLRAIDHGVVELSWMEMLELEERERTCGTTRTPGRSVQMHEKLSSPSRKRAAEEDPGTRKQKQEEKQRKAEEARERLLRERMDSLHELNRKISETRKQREQLQAAQKTALGRKMELADRKRQSVLEAKVQRAQEESEKANEIAFINKLEAANRQHDIMTKQQEVEQRLHEAEEERLRKAGEAKAKMLEAEERRKLLENERLQKLQELQQKRQRREQHVELMQAEREQQRLEKKEANQRDREERIAQLQARREGHREVIRSKIQAKQEASERLYLEHVQQVRTKAQEMRIPKHSPLLAQVVRQREAASTSACADPEAEMEAEARTDADMDADADADAEFDESTFKADDYTRSSDKENKHSLSSAQAAETSPTDAPATESQVELEAQAEPEPQVEAKQSKRKLRKLQEREAREERKLAKKLANASAKKAATDSKDEGTAAGSLTPTPSTPVAASPAAKNDEARSRPPKNEPLSTPKFCSACNAHIQTDLQLFAHLRRRDAESCTLVDANNEQLCAMLESTQADTEKRARSMLKRKTKVLQRLRKAQSLPSEADAQLNSSANSAQTGEPASWLVPVTYPLLATTQKSVQKFTRDFRTLVHGANESGPWSAKKVQVFERLLLDAERNLFVQSSVSSNVAAAWWHEFETSGLLDTAFHLLERDLQNGASTGSSRDRRVAKVPDSSLVQVAKFICKCFQVLSCNVDVNLAFVRHLLTRRSDRLIVLLDLITSRLSRSLDSTEKTTAASVATDASPLVTQKKPRTESASKKSTPARNEAASNVGSGQVEIAPILNSVLQLLNQFWLMLDSCKRQQDETLLRSAELDIISYLVSTGFVERQAFIIGAKRALCPSSGSNSSINADRRTDEYEFAYLTSLLFVLLLRRCRTLASGEGTPVGSESRRMSIASGSNSSNIQTSVQPATDTSGLLESLLRRDAAFVNTLQLLYNTLVVDRVELDGLLARVAVCALKMLNECACSDAVATQTALGSDSTRFQYLHVCGLLLTQATRQPKVYEALISELIVSLGYFAQASRSHQDCLREPLCAPAPCIMAQLCSVPMEYFIDAKLSRVLYPTLLAACFENSANTQLMEAEVSPKLLANFLEEKLLDAEQDDVANRPVAATLTYAAESRFPRRYWQPAVAYFCNKQH